MTEPLFEENVEATGFKSVKEVIAHFEATEGDTVDKAEVLEALNSLPSRKGSGQRRGQLAGLSLDQMSDEQLKREVINANSVLYKAKQRGAGEDTIEKNQARVDAALEEKAKRAPEAPAKEEATEGVYEVDADAANEL